VTAYASWHDVDARAIGVMQMRDDEGIDDKLLAVNVGDPAFADTPTSANCPST
jgi:inorganic pyrophosphatase